MVIGVSADIPLVYRKIFDMTDIGKHEAVLMDWLQ